VLRNVPLQVCSAHVLCLTSSYSTSPLSPVQAGRKPLPLSQISWVVGNQAGCCNVAETRRWDMYYLPFEL